MPTTSISYQLASSLTLETSSVLVVVVVTVGRISLSLEKPRAPSVYLIESTSKESFNFAWTEDSPLLEVRVIIALSRALTSEALMLFGISTVRFLSACTVPLIKVVLATPPESDRALELRTT